MKGSELIDSNEAKTWENSQDKYFYKTRLERMSMTESMVQRKAKKMLKSQKCWPTLQTIVSYLISD